MKKIIFYVLILASLFSFSKSFGQEKRTQYPSFLTKSYFEINIGSINYPFSAKELEPGFTVEDVTVPHWAVRIIPIGYKFNDFLSLQVSYMRPVLWIRYKNINGDGHNHPVYMNVGGFTLKGQAPITSKFKLFAEAGLGVITRSGFSNDANEVVVKDVNYGTFLFAGGLKYQHNAKWAFQFISAYSPANQTSNQPQTTFFGGGFTFNMTPLPQEKVEKKAQSDYLFPKHMVQVGYSTNTFGYEVNSFVSGRKIPIFWGGVAQVKSGITLHYQRNVFHGRKVFMLDWGTSLSYWVSNIDEDKFFTLSAFPVFRFNLIRTKPLDFYLNYSLAGPTFISKLKIDEVETGPKFTFQDFMGAGFYFGKKREFNSEVRIAHYSNGNLFPKNEGVMIPMTFNLGYTF